MQAEVHASEIQGPRDLLILQFAEQIGGTAEEPAARHAYRQAFERLRSRFAMHPASAPGPSAVFESVARTVRVLAAQCLPLGIAVAMHLYPLCTLQCVPLPLLSPARFKRALLLRSIRNQSLIVANAGSERARGPDQPLLATRTDDGIRIDGTCEYMSLGSVADIVLFKAKFTDGASAFCAADLRAGSVRIGPWKFAGRMRLSDTSSVTFTNHAVPHGRYVCVRDDSGLQRIADYQRSWFHLFLAELYLARLEHLHRVWRVPRTAEHVVSLNEVSCLRESSLRLLDNFSSSNADIEPLMKTSSVLKLRVSLLAQSTVAALRSLGDPAAADDAGELCYIKWQPTADERILSNLGWTDTAQS